MMQERLSVKIFYFYGSPYTLREPPYAMREVVNIGSRFVKVYAFQLRLEL